MPGLETGIKEYYGEEVFMNKIRFISVSIIFLLILNGCSIVSVNSSTPPNKYTSTIK